MGNLQSCWPRAVADTEVAVTQVQTIVSDELQALPGQLAVALQTIKTITATLETLTTALHEAKVDIADLKQAAAGVGAAATDAVAP